MIENLFVLVVMLDVPRYDAVGADWAVVPANGRIVNTQALPIQVAS